MDGAAAATHIMRDQAERGFRVPVVALTASISPSERARSAAAGCVAHWNKPVSAALVDSLDALVVQSRMAAP